jgi:pilus assembly protein CpaB
MKLGRVLVLGVAAGAGLVAAVIAMNLVRQPEPAPVVVEGPAEPAPTSKVLVAAVDIPIGTTISAEAVEWRDWPATGVSDQFIKEVAGTDQLAPIVGAIARASFYQGEPITEGKLIRSDQGYMAAILPAGMRAIATNINVVTSAGGFILPNDRVDVIMVRAGDAGVVTEVILSNIRVLAIDQTIEDKDGKKVVVGQTATLELTPRQVQILAAAQPIASTLMLSLRSIADSRPDPADAELDAVHLIDASKREGVVTVVKGGVPRDVSGLR